MKQNTHPEDVRASVRKRGATLSSVAQRNGLHVSTVSHALRRCIPAANKAIAAYLGVAVWTLWPEWFDKQGRRRGRDRVSRSPRPGGSPKAHVETDSPTAVP